jgi:hypothetical protein
MYALLDPANGTDPTGRATHVIVVDDPEEWVPGGEHVAMYVDERDGRAGVLYDPGGSFAPDSYEGVRGSGAYFQEGSGDLLLAEFIAYETRSGRRVTVTTVETTAADEATILQRTGGPDGSDPGPMNCASACSSVTRGVGPFDDRGSGLPGGVQDNAERAAERAGGHQAEYQRQPGSAGPTGALKKRWISAAENSRPGSRLRKKKSE